MRNQQIELCIQTKDKLSLYRFYIDRKITDKELLESIIEIDNSIKSKKTDWLKLIHIFLFPSVVR